MKALPLDFKSPFQMEKNIGFIIFLLTCAWMILLTQGLPFADLDDWDRVLLSQDISWPVLIENLIVPWSKAHHWISQHDLADQVLGRRLVLGIALKSLVSVFQFHPFPYYFFTKALFFSGTIAILFFMLLAVTHRLPYALLGSFFFVMVPAHYIHAIWISASETMLHFFMVVALWIYVKLVENQTKKFWIWLILLFVAGWLAIKTKETALILPLFLGCFTVTQLKQWKSQPLKLSILISSILYMTFLFIPIEHLQGEGLPGMKFHWTTIQRLVFQNYHTAFEDETANAFISLEQFWPVSIARTFTAPLLWTFVILFGLYVIDKAKNKSARFVNHPFIQISLIWIPLELLFMGFFQADPRYFSGTMIPLTLVGARFTQSVLVRYGGFIKKALAALVIGSLMYNFYVNVQHVIWFRQQAGKKANAFLNISKTLYEDQYPQKKLSLRDLGLYHAASYIPDDHHPRLENIIYFSPLEYEEWNQTNSPNLQDFERMAKHDVRYYVTESLEDLSDHPNVKLIKILDRMNSSSVFEHLLYHFKRKKPAVYYIYKYVGQ